MITKVDSIKKLDNYPIEVVRIIQDNIKIFDENYGANRKVETDLGGYIVIAENIVDIEILKQNVLKNVTAEYTDLIECKEGVNYTSSLFLLSSDFSIVVVTTEELSKLLLE